MNQTCTAAARSRCMPDYWLEGRQPGRLRLTIKRHAKTRKSEAQVKDMHPQPNSPLEESLACMRVRLPVTKKNLRLRSALLAIGGRVRTMVGIMLVAPALLGEWLSYWQPDLLSVVIRGSGVLFIGYVVLEFLRFIVRAPRVD